MPLNLKLRGNYEQQHLQKHKHNRRPRQQGTADAQSVPAVRLPPHSSIAGIPRSSRFLLRSFKTRPYPRGDIILSRHGNQRLRRLSGVSSLEMPGSLVRPGLPGPIPAGGFFREQHEPDPAEHCLRPSGSAFGRGAAGPGKPGKRLCGCGLPGQSGFCAKDV